MSAVTRRIPGVVYPPESRTRRYVEAGALPDVTIVAAFEEIARKHPERVAVSDVKGNISYSELNDDADRIGAALLKIGLRPLDRVIFQLNNSRELIIALLACFKAGLIPIATLAAHRKHEISYLGRHASARAHLVEGDSSKFDFVDFAKSMRDEIPTLEHIIVTRGNVPDPSIRALGALRQSISVEDARAVLASVPRESGQVAIFQLSGGTTSISKIIPRFHNEYLQQIRSVISWHGLDHTIVAYTPNPLLHNAPLICYWGPALFAGGEVVVTENFEPQTVKRALHERKVNWFGIPPVILMRLKAAGVLDELDFSHVKGFTVPGGAKRIEAATRGAPVFPLFGMTEGFISYCRAGDSREAIETTCGRATSPLDEVRILIPGTETECAPGETGELAVRGPSTILGYFDAEERNKEAITSDGFYRSGDLCSLKIIDGAPHIVFQGRLKDVVSRGGEKINCLEVETASVAHPKIASISVVPVPDPDYGERACACVIPAPGVDSLTSRELGQFLETHGLAKFKWPEFVELVTEFPSTSAGKISKPQLTQLVLERLKARAGVGAEPVS
jgi:non-ribosomal peptide synthetase component E (peptide arylation enzyme)